MKLSLAKLRLRGIWLLVLPFFWFARPTVGFLLAGGAITVAGLVVRAWAASWIHKDQVLATSGPYAHTRNPLYLGTFLLGVGVTLAGGHPTFIVLFLIFFALIYGKTMAAEAAHLQEVFGEPYLRFSEQVPLFFPRLRPYADKAVGSAGPTATESTRYRTNREYEALLGATAAFAVLVAKMIWAA